MQHAVLVDGFDAVDELRECAAQTGFGKARALAYVCDERLAAHELHVRNSRP